MRLAGGQGDSAVGRQALSGQASGRGVRTCVGDTRGEPGALGSREAGDPPREQLSVSGDWSMVIIVSVF